MRLSVFFASLSLWGCRASAWTFDPFEQAVPSWRLRFETLLKQDAVGPAHGHGIEGGIALDNLPCSISVSGLSSTSGKPAPAGPLAFPLPKVQADQIREAATTAAAATERSIRTLPLYHRTVRGALSSDQKQEEEIMSPHSSSEERSMWQLEPNQLNFGDDGKKEKWNAKVQSFVNQAVEALRLCDLLQDQNVTFEFHKALLQNDEGGLCDEEEEQDTVFKASPMKHNKKAGQFATLAIQLPSFFGGGSMKFWDEKSKSLKTVHVAENAESSLVWVVWYSTCPHLIAPLTSGHRIVLLYNLIATPSCSNGSSPALNLESHDSAMLSCLNILVKEWKEHILSRTPPKREEPVKSEEELQRVLDELDQGGWIWYDEEEFVNEIFFVHDLHHPYTVSGWGAPDLSSHHTFSPEDLDEHDVGQGFHPIEQHGDGLTIPKDFLVGGDQMIAGLLSRLQTQWQRVTTLEYCAG